MPVGGLHSTNTSALFCENGNRWKWILFPTASGDTIVIESQPSDVIAPAARRLDAVLTTFADSAEGWLTRSEQAKSETIEALMSAGRSLTDALFDGRDGEFVAALKASDQRTVTNMTFGFEHQHLIDFCVLRDGEREFFLGEWCLSVNRMVAKPHATLEKDLDGSINGTRERRIGYAEDGSLNSACLQHERPTRPEVEEIYVLKQLCAEMTELSVLDPMSRDVSASEIGMLRDWLAEERKAVVHFNCHAELFGEESVPRMRVREGGFIGAPELPHDVDLEGTLVFLNTCSSARGRDSMRTSLAQYFRQQLSPCVICTTGPVEDGFATRFARALYRRLAVERQPIASALMGARLDLWEAEHNPLAFGYTYVGADTFLLF